jgi:hypothetical protein
VNLNCLLPTKQQRPWGVLVLGCGLPGATAAAVSLGEQSLQAVGIPGLDFPERPQGAQFRGTAALSGELSQLVAGVLRLDFLHRLLEAPSCCAVFSLGEQSLNAVRVLEPHLLHGLQGA